MMGGSGGMGDMPGWMVAFMGVAGVIWLLVGIAVVVLIVVAAVWLASRLRRDVATGGRISTAIDELDHRYARGELDRDTYLQMRKDIVGR
jgi:putative membrane protein